MAASGSAATKKSTTKSTTSKDTSKSRKTSSRATTTGKSTGAARKSSKSKKELQLKEDEIKDNVIVLAVIACTVILLLSNFNLAGSVGGRIKWFMFGLIGIVEYLFPIIMLGIVFFLISNREYSAVARVKSAALIFLMLMLSSAWQRIVDNPAIKNSSVVEFYKYSAEYKNGGGLFGGIVCKLLSPLGMWGSMVVIVILSIICIVIISEKSFINGMMNVQKKGTRMVHAAKQDYDIYKEHSAGRKSKRDEISDEEYLERRRQQTENRLARKDRMAEEKKIARMDKKALGVTKDTKLKKRQNDSKGIDLHEITIGEDYLNDEYSEDIYDINDLSTESEMNKAMSDIADDGFIEDINHIQQYEELGFTQNEGVYGNVQDDSLIHMVSEKLGETIEETIKDASLDAFELNSENNEYVNNDIYENDIYENSSPESDKSENGDYESQMEYDISSQMKNQPENEYENYQENEYETQSFTEKNVSSVDEAGDTEKETHNVEPKDTPLQNETVQKHPLSDNESGIISNMEVKTEKKKYVFPPIGLLTKGKNSNGADQMMEKKTTAMRLQQTLQNFGVKVTITDISCGPSVTRYELQPEQGVKVSKIVSLSDDIKLNLAAADIRIEAPIPGKAAIGIEVPNKEPGSVMLRDLLESEAFHKHSSPIAFAAGKDIAGKTIVADIAKMPHLLIAGATGSGKSVCINTIIMSILYKADPEDVKLIMVDPKVVELSVYNGIPHLMIPVVTDCKKASGALNWAVAEMTDRYKKFAAMNVRDLKGYNAKIARMETPEGEEPLAKMPQIVIIIDELADLMMVAPGEVEDAICRLAQLARAAGIHLVIATQRPSVNVITGLIKANVPSRIAFSVSSGVDSRTIIDMNGAEKLLGKGDMLFYPSGYPKPVRVQGAFVSDDEVGRVVDFLKEQVQNENVYNEEITSAITSAQSVSVKSTENERDPYFAEAARFVIEKEKGSIGMLQRYYKIGFNRAGRIMDQLADAGVVGPELGTKPRKIQMTLEEFEEYLKKNN